MADADEAVGNHVEEEAAEELIAVEVHDLQAVAVGVVTPPEADAAVGDGDEAVVGERDAVGVAAEIREHMVGPGEGRLAIDDPGLLAQLGGPRPKRRGGARGGPGAPGSQVPPNRSPPPTRG